MDAAPSSPPPSALPHCDPRPAYPHSHRPTQVLHSRTCHLITTLACSATRVLRRSTTLTTLSAARHRLAFVRSEARVSTRKLDPANSGDHVSFHSAPRPSSAPRHLSSPHIPPGGCRLATSARTSLLSCLHRLAPRLRRKS